MFVIFICIILSPKHDYYIDNNEPTSVGLSKGIMTSIDVFAILKKTITLENELFKLSA